MNQFNMDCPRYDIQQAPSLRQTYNILGQLALKALNLSSQSLHLLRLRGNDLGLLGNQIFDFFDLALDGAGGQAGLAGGRGCDWGLAWISSSSL